MPEPLRVLLLDDALAATTPPPTLGADRKPLVCMRAASATWPSSLDAESLPFDAVVLPYQAATLAPVQALAAQQGSVLIAVGPDDSALAEVASDAGAAAYLLDDASFWYGLPHVLDSVCFKQRVEQVEEFKDHFISVASHELKNPLAALRGYAELLLRRFQRSNGDERALRGLITILQQSVRMQHILDDLHDLARLSRGGLELHCRTYNLEQLLQRASDRSERASSNHTVDLQLETSQLTISGDGERLQRVFTNLIGVAATHNNADSPVEVRVESAHNEEPWVTIKICSYSGLTVEEIERAFDDFYLSGYASSINATERLALHVSAQLIDMHHGQVQYSRLPAGDGVFEVALPLSQEPTTET